MMTLSPHSLGPGQAELYFDEHYSQDDYYTQNQKCVGRWIGKGAAQLGLAGEVTREDFAALLQGVHPRTGVVLVPPAVGSREHAAGWDCVFSAPKSVSIQALVGDDSRLIRAHISSVERAVNEVEAYAMSRRRGGRELVVSANLVGVAFDHLAARPVGDGSQVPDPQLHTHVPLLNVTRRPDGQWRGLSPVEIYRSQIFGTAVYRSELAREVQRLGYRVTITGGDGRWELEGYSREQVMAFSRRRQEIEQSLNAAGLKGAAAAQNAALNTRQAKRDYDETELKAQWQVRAQEHGIDAAAILWQALGRSDQNRIATEDCAEAVAFARTHTTERDAVVDRRALEAAALQHAMGRSELQAVRAAIAVDEQCHTLVRAGKPDWQHPGGTFTTDEMLTLERENLTLVRTGIGQATPLATTEAIQSWGTKRGLFADQIEAAKITLASKNRVSAIEGLAGTAKTTTVGAIREFAEGHGYQVRGFGMTSGSVKALAGAGVAARTIASLLENQLERPTGPELWIVDESSLLATRPTNRILKAADQLGVERMIFVGDQRQHQAIEAGAPLRQLLADNLAVAELRTIRRQRDPQLKQVVEFVAEGRVREALTLLTKQRRITEVRDPGDRYQRIAHDYLQAHDAGQQTLVVSPANDERQALNERIRQLLVDHKVIDSCGQAHEVLIRRDLTRAQLTHVRSYQEGDSVAFSRGSKKLGIDKGVYLGVDSVDPKSNTLTLKRSDGSTLQLNPARWRGLELYRPEQRTIAVGDRIQFRAPHRTSKIANGEFATIVSLDDRQARLRLDRRREVIAPLAQLKHVDYGYASTSHAAQGATVDRVIVNIDTNRGAQLVNRRQFYVSISRARYDIHVYTDDATALGRQVSRDREKANALEFVRNRPTAELKTNRTRPLDRSAPTELIDNQQIKQAPLAPRMSFAR